METQATDAKLSTPWGISFDYDPPRGTGVTPSALENQAARNWGELAWALPGWEIRQSPGKPKGYLAFPPTSLIRVTSEQPDPEEEIARRFTRLKGVDGTSEHVLQRAVSAEVVRQFLVKPGDKAPDEALVQELCQRSGSDQFLAIALQKWLPGDSRLTVVSRLLGPESAAADKDKPSRSSELPATLRSALRTLRNRETRKLRDMHLGALSPGVSPGSSSRQASHGAAISAPQRPVSRELRVYSFDPSLGTMLETAPIQSVKIPVRWEDDLKPGPIGEYLEVVDVDPASDCAYAPVDLNHPYVLAQDGLLPSEGNPQFHQQMVYAVAMNTIHRFEVALGRPVFWSHLRPWLRDRPEERKHFTPEARALQERRAEPGTAARVPLWDASQQMRYVQRLRIYPHARRDGNAYYSPTSRSILFGYFPSADVPGHGYPGGTVFTCLSHDIVAHETTHALVDGMHPYFSEPSNQDVLAFHEAFADIMALFQHFTYPEVVRDQLANNRGDLETDNLLGQLAQQFGQATGERGSLRNYLGEPNDEGKWERTKPDPRLLETLKEPHERGRVLVSAVFDAFLDLYDDRIRDLLRIATGGSGILPAGQIHPDLTNRLAAEAAAAAEQILRICIRAMDYLPPVDVTFGEFLRALITADYDLSPLGRKNRIAFIDAFRSWGIYPADVTTLSEESLRWRPPEPDSPLIKKLKQIGEDSVEPMQIAAELVSALDRWQPGAPRDEVFRITLDAQAELHRVLEETQKGNREEVLPGLDWREEASFSVGNLRPARRVGPQGEFRTEMVVEIVQKYRPPEGQSDELIPRRGGATLIIDLRTLEVRYIIFKRLYKEKALPPVAGKGGGTPVDRLVRQMPPDGQALWLNEQEADLPLRLSATYSGTSWRQQATRDEPFALVHQGL